MAIFTSIANYLKCRNYFESVLGFRFVEKYPDETQADYESDIDGFSMFDSGTNSIVGDYNNYGIFCRKSNRILAHNIWFLYGKAKPWKNGDDVPPKEIETGFVLNDESENEESCGFVLDEETDESSGFDFIGMKRLLPINYNELDVTSKVSSYKDVVKFAKLKTVEDPDNPGTFIPMSPEKLLNYDLFEAKLSGDNGLNTNQPNSLLLVTSYDYDDFGFNQNKREYNIRQLGMLTNLHIKIDNQSFISDKITLYNNMPDSNNNTKNLSKIFNISDNSIIIPNNFVLEDRFTSLVNGEYQYSSIPEWLRKELHLDDGGSGIRPNSAVTSDNTFFGILQFYINTIPNNRITFQTDTYNFILSFENQIKCSCTCLNCNC